MKKINNEIYREVVFNDLDVIAKKRQPVVPSTVVTLPVNRIRDSYGTYINQSNVLSPILQSEYHKQLLLNPQFGKGFEAQGYVDTMPKDFLKPIYKMRK